MRAIVQGMGLTQFHKDVKRVTETKKLVKIYDSSGTHTYHKDQLFRIILNIGAEPKKTRKRSEKEEKEAQRLRELLGKFKK